MADNENPTDTPNDASRTNVTPPENQNVSQGQTGTSFSAGDLNQEDYMLHLEGEVIRLKAIEQQFLIDQQARSSQQIPQTLPPVISTVPPSLVTSQIPTSLPYYHQQQHDGIYQTSAPFSSSGPSGYQIPVFPPQYQHKFCSFKTFKSSGPSDYSGGTNPSVTLDWLRDVERKFEVCRCEDEVKVPYAVQLLKGPAMGWWDSITSHLTPQQRASIRWPDSTMRFARNIVLDLT